MNKQNLSTLCLILKSKMIKSYRNERCIDLEIISIESLTIKKNGGQRAVLHLKDVNLDLKENQQFSNHQLVKGFS